MTFSLGRRALIAAFAALGFSATGLAAQDGYEPGRLEIIVPFNPGVGKTPRAIVIERQKRLFALQDLAQVRR